MTQRTVAIVIGMVLGIILLGVAIGFAADAAKPSMKAEVDALKVPPAWLADVKITYDTKQPWAKGRQEIRRLISLGTEDARKQAIKLTWLYLQKNDIGNGGEYSEYLFLTGEIPWTLWVSEQFVEDNPSSHIYLRLASLYRYYGEYPLADTALQNALKNLPKDPWKISGEVDVWNAYGNLYADQGLNDQAKQAWEKAIKLIPTSNQPYNRDKFTQKMDIIKTKVALLDHTGFAPGLKDGTYTGSSWGYVDAVTSTVIVKDGKVADIKIKHRDNAHQNAATLVPQRIIEQQSMKVDGVTGATFTSEAVVDSTYRALNKAGVK